MNKVELNKMLVDTALSNLQDKLHHIIDGIDSAKAFDQYNAKCGEIDRLSTENATLTAEIERLRDLVIDAYREGYGAAEYGTFDYSWFHSYAYEVLHTEESK
jgi:hypothetical protein